MLTIEEAFASFGTPGIVNTDQGSQFRAEGFTLTVLKQGCKLYLNSNGVWLDNVFVERLWRSLDRTTFAAGDARGRE